MLDVQSVTVTFGGVRAVQDVSFGIDAECLGIVGANGAGKTTLLNAISGLAPLRSGRVMLDGDELSSLGAARRARFGVGRSFQHPLLMDAMTVEENLVGGRRAGRTALGEVVWAFGLDRWMMRPVAELPYGIRKVADLARAAMTGTRILLCDEPFSGLDETGREDMAKVLQGLRRAGPDPGDHRARHQPGEHAGRPVHRDGFRPQDLRWDAGRRNDRLRGASRPDRPGQLRNS